MSVKAKKTLRTEIEKNKIIEHEYPDQLLEFSLARLTKYLKEK